VLASVVAFLAVVVILSDFASFGGTRRYAVAFPLELGTPGLAVGADGSIGMIKVGRVASIEPRPEGALPEDDADDHDEPHVRVTVEIDETYTLRAGAIGGLVVPILGSQSLVNFDDLGTGEPLDENAIIRGTLAPPLILRASGIGPGEIEQVQSIITRIESISGNVDAATADARRIMRDDVGPILDDVEAVTGNAREITGNVRERVPGWSDAIDRLVARGERIADEVRLAVDDVRALIDESTQGISDLRGVVAENREDLRTTTDNVAALTAEARETTLPRINEALAEGRAAVETAAEALERMEASLVTDLPEISRILGNARIASNNLKLAMIEIRSAPWKLLYTPGEEEAEKTMLHDTVRTYANAVSDLADAATALRALHDRYGGNVAAEQPERLDLVLDQLEASFDAYRQVEQEWFRMILEED